MNINETLEKARAVLADRAMIIDDTKNGISDPFALMTVGQIEDALKALAELADALEGGQHE